MTNSDLAALALLDGSPMNEAELLRFGRALGAELRAGDVVALSGELGAGKTTLVRAICEGAGVREPVTSPTFALLHEYRSGAVQIVHADLYRLKSEVELDQLGFVELLESGRMVLIEWPEVAASLLPPDALLLHLEHLPDQPDRRQLRAARPGSAARA